MLRIIHERFGNIAVQLCPASVQGAEAASEIAGAIRYFNETNDVDVIIIGRGGGSYEDLAPFNEEIVARAIFDSTIPVVSAVGHEIDFTIADFVADVRAPTPTAAAAIVCPEKSDILRYLAGMRDTLCQAMQRKLDRAKYDLVRNVMEFKDRKDFFDSHRIYLDDLSAKPSAQPRIIHDKQTRKIRIPCPAHRRPQPDGDPGTGIQHHGTRGHRRSGHRRINGIKRRSTHHYPAQGQFGRES